MIYDRFEICDQFRSIVLFFAPKWIRLGTLSTRSHTHTWHPHFTAYKSYIECMPRCPHQFNSHRLNTHQLIQMVFCYLWNGLVESHNDKTHTHTNGVVKRTTYQPMTDICAPFHFTTAVIRISCRSQAFVIDSMMTNARNGHRPCEIMDWTSYSSLSGFQLVLSTPAFPSLWPNCPRTKSINYGWYLDRIVVECLWQVLQASHPFCVTLNCHLKTFADTLHSVTDLYGHAFTSKFHVPHTKFSITLESYRSMWNVSHRQCSNNSILKCNSFLAEFTGERWPGSLHCRLIAVRFH